MTTIHDASAQTRGLDASMKRRIGAGLLIPVVCAGLFLLSTAWSVSREPDATDRNPLVVNDVSQLNPIAVASVITPTATDEVVAAVRSATGAITIGGARHSMGGQIATTGALHIDMRRFNRILAFSPADKTITVQAGATWRDIQERVDQAGLSIAVMQTYANFTVGGSLSVNAHGRYVGRGPLIGTVSALTVVLADGRVVHASPANNQEVFYGVIGGYGGLGVIVEATLLLTENTRIKRTDRTMPITEYGAFFAEQIRNSNAAVFHNGDIYPNDYDTVHAVTYLETKEAAEITGRLSPRIQAYAANRLALWMISDWPFGKEIRKRVLDPLLFLGEPVTWRNYEASYDTVELEPSSRNDSTYVLQEYFIPESRFDDFVPRMREVFQRHDVNVINVSIRHARKDPGSLLAWARSDVFAFVVYYKQRTDETSRREVGHWTRELIDAAILLDGSYYLPYQVLATREQFLRAYPRAPEWFALKRRLDPVNKFRNKLWDAYYVP